MSSRSRSKSRSRSRSRSRSPRDRRMRSQPSSFHDALFRRDARRGFSQSNLCNNCKQPGHFARECTNIAVYNNCGLPGHIAAECTTKSLCWNCREPGHMASNCLNGGRGHMSFECPSGRMMDRMPRSYAKTLVSFIGNSCGYASLFFCMCIDQDDNKLEVLEIIHYFVEILDRYFGSVCELDLIFNFHKAYCVLDEILIAGDMQESSKKTVARLIATQDSLVEKAQPVI